MYDSWHAPQPDGSRSEEMMLTLARGRSVRLLVLPPLFDEHNKTRRQTVELMRRLDLAGIDTFCPDMPGCNESLASMERQTLEGWQGAARSLSDEIGATHVFAMRGSALFAPAHLPRFLYAPVKGKSLLRALLRARIIASREAGTSETSGVLVELGRSKGLELAGWQLNAEMFRQIEQGDFEANEQTTVIEQVEVGGAPLWLRAEPGEDPAQAAALAKILVRGILGQ